MKRKGAPAKEGKCPRDAPKDQKCDNCRSKKGACQFAERIAAANATLSPGEPSTSERPRPQAAADSDMDDAEPRPSRERKPRAHRQGNFKNTTHYLWISEQYEKTGIRADWTFFCSCHGKCDCDPEGGACKNVVKLHQLRDSAQHRTIINNIDELAAFLEANFKNPTKSYFAKKGGGAIYQRHIHYVKASEIEVTRRDLVHAEYSLKKSDCYRQICDIGEPGVVVCRHRSCHQCRHDHKDEVGGDCIDLDFACCKEEAHCGAPQERALTAVQFEQDEKAMALRALALQEQARRIQSGEIVCVANHDVETKSCLPFLIGKVCQSPFLAFEDSFIKSER